MEVRNEIERRRFASPGGLIKFIRHYWDVLEPTTKFVDGWAINAICQHLEAVSAGLITRLLINVPPGFAKALDCDTPVLTTWGWKRHGDLVAGDFVFGPDGLPKRIVAVTDHKIEPSYTVKFDDGALITAGEGHLWQVERDHPYGGSKSTRCRKSEIVTTPELIASVKGRVNQRPDRIGLSSPVQMPAKRLLIDPYVLGAWLGDGASNSGVIYTAQMDVDHFSKFGYQTKQMPKTIEGRQNFYRITVYNLSPKLRMLSLLNNKHIPDDYLEASIEQRWELVRGLMDTDGTASKTGHCSYVTKLPHLAAQIITLLCSLGIKAHCSETWSVNNGVRFGPYQQIVFTAPIGVRVFALARKQERVKFAESSRVTGRYVASVEPAGEREVNCIQVEGGLYLCGKNFVTTHNSLIVNVFWPAWEWSTIGAHLRYVSFSYASHLTTRDNEKFRDLILSAKYQEMYGKQFTLVKIGSEKVQSDKTGWKFASSVGGVGTGERGDRILCFPSDALVATEYGPVSMDQLVRCGLGVRIWSFNEKTGKCELKPVIKTFKNPGRKLVRIATLDGGTMTCTYDHLVRTVDRGYVEAGSLRNGDCLAALPRGVGSSGPPIRDPKVKVKVAPSPSSADAVNGGDADAKLGGQNSTGIFVACRDLAYKVFGKVRRAVFESAVSLTIRDVLRASAVLDIFEPRVSPVVVLVSDLLPWRATPDERFRHHLMRETEYGFPIEAHRISGVALVQDKSHDFSGNRKRFPVSHRGPGHAAEPACIGNLVSPAETDSVEPTFTVVAYVEEIHEVPQNTYCVSVEGNHTLCVGDCQFIICHNCDDPHNVKEAESEAVREGTVQWFREAMQNRLNDLAKGVIIVIMQRVNEGDVSGCVLEHYPNYEHLCIPMEYEEMDVRDGEKVGTSIGWQDPRTEWGELAWPERYPEEVLIPFKNMIYTWSGQYQQAPTPRGGGIIKSDYWRIWDAEAQASNDVKAGTYPAFDYVLASFDGALGQKLENDWSALTVWGTWVESDVMQRAAEQFGTPSIMLIGAWRKKLTLHGKTDLVPLRGETKAEFDQRKKENWGLVEHIADTCQRLRVNKLLIEAKANGHDVANEMRRLYSREDWMVVLDDPGVFDKTARTYSVQHFFADGRVWRPDTDWADMVSVEMSQFPKGSHDDLHDTAVAAIRHLRRMGLLVRADESSAAVEEMLFPSTQKKRLGYET